MPYRRYSGYTINNVCIFKNVTLTLQRYHVGNNKLSVFSCRFLIPVEAVESEDDISVSKTSSVFYSFSVKHI